MHNGFVTFYTASVLWLQGLQACLSVRMAARVLVHSTPPAAAMMISHGISKIALLCLG
jgi:hypothetical protein